MGQILLDDDFPDTGDKQSSPIHLGNHSRPVTLKIYVTAQPMPGYIYSTRAELRKNIQNCTAAEKLMLCPPFALISPEHFLYKIKPALVPFGLRCC